MPDERFVAVSGARLWSAAQGDGPPMILCHGGPGMYDYLGPLADLLDRTARTVRYDQRACGLSTGNADQTLETATGDLDEVRASYGFDRCVVAGHSWGATLALLYAAAYPDRVLGVLYIAGTGTLRDWKEEHRDNVTRAVGEADHAELRAIHEAMAAGTATDEQVLREAEITMRADVVGAQTAARATRDLLARGARYNMDVNRVLNAAVKDAIADGSLADAVSRVRVPVLVIAGEQDPRPWRIGERLARDLPNAEFHVVKDAGHLPWYERPQEVQIVISRFLDSITRRGSRSQPP